MREIKFRVWDKEARQLYYFDQTTLINNLFTFRELVCKRELKDWQQYTGFKDVHGKEIYFGDILKRRNNDSLYTGKQSEVSTVELGADDLFCWVFDNYLAHCVGDPTLEIIGNIYENPELLED